MPGDLSDLRRFLDEPVPPLAAWHWQTLRSMAQSPELTGEMSTKDAIRYVLRNVAVVRNHLANGALFHDVEDYKGPTEKILERQVCLGPFQWLTPSIVADDTSLWRDDNGVFRQISSAQRAAISATLSRIRIRAGLESQMVIRVGSWQIDDDACFLRLNASPNRLGERPRLQLLDVGPQSKPASRMGEWLLAHNVRIIDVGEWAKYDPTFESDAPSFFLNRSGEWEEMVRFPIGPTDQSLWLFRQWYSIGQGFGGDNAMRFASFATQCSLPLLPSQSGTRVTDAIRDFVHAVRLPEEIINEAIATFSGNVGRFAIQDAR